MFKLFRKTSTPAPQVEKASSSDDRLPKGRIMIVDDDPVVRKALGLKLGEAGYELLFAADGAEAVTVARNERPNVILLDINFPAEPGIGWDGFKLLRWLHRSPEGARTPVIIITGDDSPEYRERAIEAGAVGFFLKPVDNSALISAIDQLVADSRRKQA
jgi:CheY-like chemotaxis protein